MEKGEWLAVDLMSVFSLDITSQLSWASNSFQIFTVWFLKAWDKPYSAHIHLYKHANYADIEGMLEHG